MGWGCSECLSLCVCSLRTVGPRRCICESVRLAECVLLGLCVSLRGLCIGYPSLGVPEFVCLCLSVSMCAH